jgi:hypothetical protein
VLIFFIERSVYQVNTNVKRKIGLKENISFGEYLLHGEPVKCKVGRTDTTKYLLAVEPYCDGCPQKL